MSTRSFTTYEPTEEHTFDINEETFRLNKSAPGAVLLDFLGNASTDDAGAMATVLTSLFKEAIHEDDYDRFIAFTRERQNNVDLETLAEIAGYAAEKLSGSGKATQSPDTWPTVG